MIARLVPMRFPQFRIVTLPPPPSRDRKAVQAAHRHRPDPNDMSTVLAYLLYTNLFWYVVFVPLVALVCTVVTEWARESKG